MSDGWVRDPAVIEVMAKLQLFAVGDEVIVQRAEEYSISEPLDGKVAHVCELPGPDGGFRRHPACDQRSQTLWTLDEANALPEDANKKLLYSLGWNHTKPVLYITKGYYLSWQNIAAWRRPTKEKV